MDQRTLTNRIARNLDLDAKDVTTLGDAMADIFQEVLADCDAVAIPGFGTFVADKEDEHVGTDPATGTRSLMPPAISVQFRAATKLRKSVAK